MGSRMRAELRARLGASTLSRWKTEPMFAHILPVLPAPASRKGRRLFAKEHRRARLMPQSALGAPPVHFPGRPYACSNSSSEAIAKNTLPIRCRPESG